MYVHTRIRGLSINMQVETTTFFSATDDDRKASGKYATSNARPRDHTHTHAHTIRYNNAQYALKDLLKLCIWIN